MNFYITIPEDEIPYSTLSRYSLLGAYCPSQVMKQVYGKPRKRLHPYLPGRIDNFASFFELSNEDIVNHRTIYPLLRFCQPSDASKIKRAMLHDTEDRVLLSTAIGHSRFRLFYGLNYCPICVREDINKLGFTYWHIRHQIPGVQACHVHQVHLVSIPMGDGQRDRALILPPYEEVVTTPATPAQSKFATFSCQLFLLSKAHEIDYQSSYQYLLEEKGLSLPTGRNLKMAQIITHIKDYWRELTFTDHFQAGIPSTLRNFDFLGRMLRVKTHAYCHPIKHMLLACWLTEGNAEQLLVKKTTLKLTSGDELSPNDSVNINILKLLNSDVSFNQIQKITGKSRCYIKRVAGLNQLSHQSNSLTFSTAVKRAVLVKALYGIHRKVIAFELNVSRGYVEQAISNEPFMAKWRHHLSVRKRVLSAYQIIVELQHKNPAWIRADIRKHAQAAFFQLYNNDKPLLEKALPAPLKPEAYSKNWPAEDERIYQALLQLGNFSNMSVSEVDRKVNGHGNLLRKKNMLPISSKLLSQFNK